MRRAGARVSFNTILASSFDKATIKSAWREAAYMKKQVDGDKTPEAFVSLRKASPERLETSKPKESLWRHQRISTCFVNS
jgi:hydrogenase maturation factor HypE